MSFKHPSFYTVGDVAPVRYEKIVKRDAVFTGNAWTTPEAAAE